MNYGLYTSASGLLTSMYRQDVVTNNLANLETVGFKVHSPQVRQRDAARIEDDLPWLDSNEMLEKLGAGVQLAPTEIKFGQGNLRASNNPLDVAIDGDGFFVMSEGSSGRSESLRLSRDGRFTLGTNGDLVSATTGMRVFSSNNQPVRINRNGGEVTIDPAGRVLQGGTEIARLAVVDVPDRSELRKIGDNLFVADAAMMEQRYQTDAQLRQGFTEASGVNEIQALMQIRATSGAASSNAEMIRNHDRIMDLAISRLGRVS